MGLLAAVDGSVRRPASVLALSTITPTGWLHMYDFNISVFVCCG